MHRWGVYACTAALIGTACETNTVNPTTSSSSTSSTSASTTTSSSGATGQGGMGTGGHGGMSTGGMGGAPAGCPGPKTGADTCNGEAITLTPGSTVTLCGSQQLRRSKPRLLGRMFRGHAVASLVGWLFRSRLPPDFGGGRRRQPEPAHWRLRHRDVAPTSNVRRLGYIRFWPAARAMRRRQHPQWRRLRQQLSADRLACARRVSGCPARRAHRLDRFGSGWAQAPAEVSSGGNVDGYGGRHLVAEAAGLEGSTESLSPVANGSV